MLNLQRFLIVNLRRSSKLLYTITFLFSINFQWGLLFIYIVLNPDLCGFVHFYEDKNNKLNYK